MSERKAISNDRADTGSTVSSCWSCQGPVDRAVLTCATCGAIQPPQPTDHFSLFGLAPGFNIDVDELERRYFRLQRRFHPDRFATKSAREQTFSLHHATNINHAYEVLKEPLSRAKCLLVMRGVGEAEDEEAIIDDPELLAEAMERREALSAAGSPSEADDIAEAAATDVASCLAALSEAFARDDLAAAWRLTLRLTYLDKLVAETRARRARLGSAHPSVG